MNINYTCQNFESISIDQMVEKCYSENNSLIVKDLEDNVFFLCYGVYLVNGNIQQVALTKLKLLFNQVITLCKWCEFDGEIIEVSPRHSYLVFD